MSREQKKQGDCEQLTFANATHAEKALLPANSRIVPLFSASGADREGKCSLGGFSGDGPFWPDHRQTGSQVSLRNRIIRGRPFWSRLSSFVMITYERSTLDER